MHRYSFENMEGQMQQIKQLVENKVLDPNEYAGILPDVSREELETELEEMQDMLTAMDGKLDSLLGGMGHLREDVKGFLQDKQDKDQKALSRTVAFLDPKKNEAMVLEISLQHIEEEPLATGGFGTIHQARFVTLHLLSSDSALTMPPSTLRQDAR